jgi:hypothetical protein
MRLDAIRRAQTALIVITVASLATACSKSELTPSDIAAPNTGYEVTEEQVGVVAPAEVKEAKRFFISAESIRVRSTPESGTAENVLGRLFVNDQVEVIDSTPIGKEAFVKVRIISSTSAIPSGQEIYVSSKYFNSEPKAIDPVATSIQAPAEKTPKVIGQRPAKANRLFVVTNVATEKLRVYERCLPDEGCVNRMILETDVVNGENEDGNRTQVGFYQVSHWVKFYEVYRAGAKTYPAWYKPGYPAVPEPGNRTAWFSSSYMPNGEGAMRGAFGWYTKFVGPNANGQWTHGTAGWGKDKKDFILFKESFWGKLTNLFTSIRSHGCTRGDNESIAYLRGLVPVGTPLIKIYARETYRDPARSMYPKNAGRWEYILTKNGHQEKNNHQLADRQTVLNQGTPQSEWIDQGVYEVDQMPDVADGDLYKLGGSAFQGHFVVDEGTVLNYQHPSQMKRGGYSDQLVPAYMVTTNADIKGETRKNRWESRGDWNSGNQNNNWENNHGGGGN